MIALERNYELTIGANIGTTVTALLASLTQTGSAFRQSIQIALTHWLFNLSGCVLWYTIVYFRRIPIFLSRRIGNIVAAYRWFAFVYIAAIFLLFPLMVLSLAFIHWIVAIVFLVCLILLLSFILTVNYLQTTRVHSLPTVLQSWFFVPRALRSFAYWDNRLECLVRRVCCFRCAQLLYPANQPEKALKEQYRTMRDQYVTALDHRFLVHTHQLNDVFEMHYAPVVSMEAPLRPLANYVQDFYRSLTGRPTQGQRALYALMQREEKKVDEEDLVDRVIVFDRDKKKGTSVNEERTVRSF